MYIGVGTLVVILLIVLIIYFATSCVTRSARPSRSRGQRARRGGRAGAAQLTLLGRVEFVRGEDVAPTAVRALVEERLGAPDEVPSNVADLVGCGPSSPRTCSARPASGQRRLVDRRCRGTPRRGASAPSRSAFMSLKCTNNTFGSSRCAQNDATCRNHIACVEPPGEELVHRRRPAEAAHRRGRCRRRPQSPRDRHHASVRMLRMWLTNDMNASRPSRPTTM